MKDTGTRNSQLNEKRQKGIKRRQKETKKETKEGN